MITSAIPYNRLRQQQRLDTLLTLFTFCIRFPLATILWQRNLIDDAHIAFAIFISVSDALWHSLYRYELDQWKRKGNIFLRTLLLFWSGLVINKTLTYLENSWVENIISDHKTILMTVVTIGSLRMVHSCCRIKWLNSSGQEYMSSILNFVFIQVLVILNIFNIVEKNFQLWGVSGYTLIVLWFTLNMAFLYSLKQFGIKNEKA